MGNINKDILWELFRKYLIRKKHESYTSFSANQYQHERASSYNGGIIFFYEWSDLNRKPKIFYNLLAFIEFLRDCEIDIPPFQREMIKVLDRAYITCKSGKKELLIRGTRPGLLEAFERNAPSVSVHDLPEAPKVTQLSLPYYPNSQPQRMPPMYSYNGNPEEWYG